MLHSKVLHTIVSSALHKCMLAHFAHVSVLFQRSIAFLVPRLCQSECAADVMKKQLFDAARPLMCGHSFFFFFFNLFCRPEALKSRGKKETVNFAAPCSPNYSSVFTVHIQSGHYPAACLQWQRTSRLPACCSVVVAK